MPRESGAKITVHIATDPAEEQHVLETAEKLVRTIEKANSLADELARKVGNMKLGFKVGRVEDQVD